MIFFCENIKMHMFFGTNLSGRTLKTGSMLENYACFGEDCVKSILDRKGCLVVATVQHGVPLMRSKWVHRTWAHQGGTQGQGTRLTGGPPHLSCGVPAHAVSTTKTKDSGTLRGPLDPEAGTEVPGTRRPVGGQSHSREPTSSARRG